MIDLRFYNLLGPMSLGEIAAASGIALASPEDGEVQVSGCAALHDAQAGDVAFCLKAPGDGLIETAASAVIINQAYVDRLPPGCIGLIDRDPRAAFGRVAKLLVCPKAHGPGDPPVHGDAVLEDRVALGPGVIIGAGAHIGAGSSIGAGVIVGPGVQIGRDCRIGPGAVIQCALIGDRVTIGINSVVGDSGFGVAPSATGLVDVPQMGRVILQDDVSVGALVAIDRGAFGDTIIGLSSKIDNLCQIGHNVRIGRSVVIAGFSGIAGSTVVEDFVMVGARVGFADHLHIGTGARLMAGSGVINDVPAGEIWGGYPAKPRKQWVREMAGLKRLSQSGSKPNQADE
jgi:UDP-3-O-[3-hydroxymyristoyl] glucosamine N-acyltransferase